MLTSEKRQRTAANIIKWHFFTKFQGNGEPVGLRGYSHHNETDRYEIDPQGDVWELVFCTYLPHGDPAYVTLKTGTLFECMEAAELHDEQIGESLP